MNQTATGWRRWLPLTDWSLRKTSDRHQTPFSSCQNDSSRSHQHVTDTIWPAVWWPDSADVGCAGAAAGLLSAAWGAAAGLRTSDAGTGPPCSEVCGWRAGSPNCITWWTHQALCKLISVFCLRHKAISLLNFILFALIALANERFEAENWVLNKWIIWPSAWESWRTISVICHSCLVISIALVQFPFFHFINFSEHLYLFLSLCSSSSSLSVMCTTRNSEGAAGNEILHF